MDEAFYSKLHGKDGKKISFQRVTDIALQREGIDVIIEVQGNRMLIDEMATLYYSNCMIPTFAFEINSIQSKSITPIEGWLINDELKTEYYMLIWPNVKCVRNKNTKAWERVSLKKLKKYDFTIVEAILIKKEGLSNILKDVVGKNKE